MNHPLSASCDPRRLRLSLEDRLSEVEEEALAEHLTACEACRRMLERLAAQKLGWQRVEQVLRDESASDSSIGGSPAPGAGPDETIGYRHAVDYSASPVDFAVDFLDVPTRPEAMGRLADIDILKVIGHGGMGIVLKGFQPALNRFVAVKVLAPHLATSGAARQRFAREARAAAAVVHPHVMPIFTVDASGRLPYLVMPFINGESLQERIDRQGAMDAVDVLRIGMQVARGLAAAHAQGLVHRDVKPANILLERGVDRVVLTDFGLARAADDASLTRSGLIAGTPQYMSPEQARGDSIDARSDLFSLGSVLYTMCTGRPPFRADTSYGILRRIIDTDPRSIRDCQPAVPPWLENLINRLLAKAIDARFPSAIHLAEIMEQCLAHVQQPTAAAIPAELDRKSATRFIRWAAVIATILVAVGAGGIAIRQNGWPPRRTHAIEQSSDDSPVGPSITKSSSASIHAESSTSINDFTERSSVRAEVALSTADTSGEPAPRSGKAAAPAVRAPERWNDSIGGELNELKIRIQELQRRVDQPWE